MIFRKPTSILETLFLSVTLCCGGLIFSIFAMMLWLSWPLLTGGQLFDLFLGHWSPSHNQYGIFPMIVGSLSVSLVALCISFPLCLGTALMATTLAPRRLRLVIIGCVRLMAGIPTVAYGFVAIFLLVPFMREHVTGGSGLNLLTASIILALLIAPTMIVLFVSGIQNVPQQYSIAMDALGLRPIQKTLYLLIPQAWPAIVSGIILGFGRAMGDTLISLMLAGNSIALPESITDSGRTLTAHIALVIAADFDSVEFRTIFACGIVLYIFTVCFVMALRFFMRSSTVTTR